MALDLAQFEKKSRDSVKAFWGNREAARQKKLEAGTTDQGSRGLVTAGKNMDGFVALMIDIVEANGLQSATVMRRKRLLTLPGYFRPTKLWDLLVIRDGRLIAALEMKSMVGSYGNNLNNRTEEVIGAAHDLWVAFREGAFGDSPRPFVGWLMLVSDEEKSRRPVTSRSPHFPIFPEFKSACYLDRYNLLCKKLVQEQLYTSAAVIASKPTAIETGAYSELDTMTGLKSFLATFAGHIAAEAARISGKEIQYGRP